MLAAKEQPFSFYEQDAELAAAKAARTAAAYHPDRFQVSGGTAALQHSNSFTVYILHPVGNIATRLRSMLAHKRLTYRQGTKSSDYTR